jgi:hypothetical protein
MPASEDMLKPWLFTHWLTTENQIDQISKMIEAKSQQPQQAPGMPMGQPPMMGGPQMGAQAPANRLLPPGAPPSMISG